jgi:hypothetical protein
MGTGVLLLYDIRKIQRQQGRGRRNTAFPPPFTVRLSLFAPVIASLFAVGMLVAPSPVVPLFPSSLLVIRAVVSMVLLQVAPVCPILMIVPIMIIAMITIIDAQLNARLLRSRRCHDRRGHKNSSR